VTSKRITIIWLVTSVISLI